jgi:hypothetical protein
VQIWIGIESEIISNKNSIGLPQFQMTTPTPRMLSLVLETEKRIIASSYCLKNFTPIKAGRILFAGDRSRSGKLSIFDCRRRGKFDKIAVILD